MFHPQGHAPLKIYITYVLVFIGQLQKAFEASARVFGPHALKAVGKKHHQAYGREAYHRREEMISTTCGEEKICFVAIILMGLTRHATPFVLHGADELVDDALRRVAEIAKLGLPAH